MDRDDGIDSGDRLAHAEKGAIGAGGGRAQAEIIEFVQRDGLYVQTEKGTRQQGGIQVAGMAGPAAGNCNSVPARVNGPHIGAGAPGPVDRPDPVHIPAQPPGIIRRVVRYKRRAGTEAVFGRDAADRNVQRMVGKQEMGAGWDGGERESFATLLESPALFTEIGTEIGLILRMNAAGRGEQRDQNE